MPKRNKKEKQQPNFIIFLVEGKSDQIVLEIPLTEMILEKHPDYEIRFLLQKKLINKREEELDDIDDEEASFEANYDFGGDITSSSFVTPDNIVNKIYSRFFKPEIINSGLYPKRIARVIQIVDLDGAYLSNERIVSLKVEHTSFEKPYYDDKNMVIETRNIDGIIKRNERKRENIDFLLSLTKNGIKIGSKTVPYELYFFSSNLDHIINNNANLTNKKIDYANQFYEKYGNDTNKFCSYFFEDASSIGHMGYYESWEFIKNDNSVKRYTNIDCLIAKLKDGGFC